MDKVNLVIECLEKYQTHVNNEEPNLVKIYGKHNSKIITHESMKMAKNLISHVKKNNSFQDILKDQNFHVAIVWASSDYVHSLTLAENSKIETDGIIKTLETLLEIIIKLPKNKLTINAIKEMHKILESVQNRTTT